MIEQSNAIIFFYLTMSVNYLPTFHKFKFFKKLDITK